MDFGIFIDLMILVAALSGLCYWVFVAPVRARRRRQAALGPSGGRGARWHPGIHEGRRNR
jgi:hypothetical protein